MKKKNITSETVVLLVLPSCSTSAPICLTSWINRWGENCTRRSNIERIYRCAGCCVWTTAGLSQGSSSGPIQTGTCTLRCRSGPPPPRCWNRSGTPAREAQPDQSMNVDRDPTQEICKGVNSTVRLFVIMWERRAIVVTFWPFIGRREQHSEHIWAETAVSHGSRPDTHTY